MKRKIRKMSCLFRWAMGLILFAIIAVIFYGLVNFVLFSEVKTNTYGELMHVAVSCKSFTRIAMVWLMLLFSGIPFIAGWVIRGWVQIEIVDKEEEKEL